MSAKISFNVLKPTDKAVEFMEKLRFEAHGIPSDKGLNPLNTYYGVRLKEGCLLMYAVLINNIPVAGAYVSSLYDSLFIEHVFVKPELQKSDFHFGSSLIRYILCKKSELELFFQTNFTTAKIEYINNQTKQIYENLSFREDENPGLLFRPI